MLVELPALLRVTAPEAVADAHAVGDDRDVAVEKLELRERLEPVAEALSRLLGPGERAQGPGVRTRNGACGAKQRAMVA